MENNVNSKKVVVYMICGFIGAGKTTFARKLETETGAVRFTKDEWLIQIFGNTPPKDKFDEYDERICKLSTDIAFKFVESGKDVIIDDGFWIKSQREEMRKRIIDAGASPKLYYIDCPIEEMKRRTLERSKNPSHDAFVIDETMFKSYLKYWEPPELIENPVVVHCT